MYKGWNLSQKVQSPYEDINLFKDKEFSNKVFKYLEENPEAKLNARPEMLKWLEIASDGGQSEIDPEVANSMIAIGTDVSAEELNKAYEGVYGATWTPQNFLKRIIMKSGGSEAVKELIIKEISKMDPELQKQIINLIA